jgi:hypothetical protein
VRVLSECKFEKGCEFNTGSPFSFLCLRFLGTSLESSSLSERQGLFCEHILAAPDSSFPGFANARNGARELR